MSLLSGHERLTAGFRRSIIPGKRGRNMVKPESRVVLDIDLGILADNFNRISQAVSPLGVIVVLKANAYGLGMREVARALAGAGAAAIATAELDEALEAVEFGLPVIILGTVLPEELEPALAAGVRIPVAGLEEARKTSSAALALGTTAKCHLAVDTGMGRVGIRLNDAPGMIPQIASLPGIELEGMYSHFPTAYIGGDENTSAQIEAFRELAAGLADRGIHIPWLHMANSDAINNFEEACRAPFTQVKTGISLYGSC